MNKKYCLLACYKDEEMHENFDNPLEYDCSKEEAIKFLTELGRHPDLPVENRRVAEYDKATIEFDSDDIFGAVEERIWNEYENKCFEDWDDYATNHWDHVKTDDEVIAKINELVGLLNKKHAFNDVYTVAEDWTTLEMLRGEGND